MSGFIDEFRIEHLKIMQGLMQVKALGVSSREGQKMLRAARKMLLEHLKKEDELLYPALRNAAGRNPELQLTLDVMEADLREVTRIAIDFFDTYTEDSRGLAFFTDFGKLFMTLQERVIKEDKFLFSQLGKISQGWAAETDSRGFG